MIKKIYNRSLTILVKKNRIKFQLKQITQLIKIKGLITRTEKLKQFIQIILKINHRQKQQEIHNPIGLKKKKL